MAKPNKLVDISIIIIAILLACQIYYWPVIGAWFLSINVNLSLITILISIIFKRYQHKKAQYYLLVLLILFCCDILKVNIESITGDVTETSYSASVGSFSFNILSVIFIWVFVVIHKKVFYPVFNKIFYGSVAERASEWDKMVVFYSDKFNAFTPDELNDAFKMFNEYPPEAREALKKINAELG